MSIVLEGREGGPVRNCIFAGGFAGRELRTFDAFANVIIKLPLA